MQFNCLLEEDKLRGWLEIRTKLKGKSVGSGVLIGVGRVARGDILPNA